MGNKSKMTPIVQSQIIVALANGEDRKTIAARFEITERTLINWLKKDTFQREYDEACQRLHKAGIAILCEGAQEAAYSLRSIISDPETPKAVKIRAIDVLLRHTQSSTKEMDLITAFSVLAKEGVLPPDISKIIIGRINNLGKEVIDVMSNPSDDAETGKDKALAMIKMAVLGHCDI